MQFLFRHLLVAVIGLLAARAQAVTLATWDFRLDTQPAADGRAPNTLDSNLESIQGMTRGGGLTPVSTSRVFSSEGWGDNDNGFTTWASKDAAIAGLDFLMFSLAPASGNEVSFDTLDYKIRRTNTGPSRFIWQFQVGTGEFSDIGEEVEYTVNDSHGLFQPQLALSDIPALQGVQEAVTFRLVAWNNTGTGSFGIGRSTSSTTEEDTLILTGSAGPIGGGLDGDFNDDGNVDAADYVVWREEMRPQDDYLLWQANFGPPSAGAGASVGPGLAVPEPSYAVLLLTLSSLTVVLRVWR